MHRQRYLGIAAGTLAFLGATDVMATPRIRVSTDIRSETLLQRMSSELQTPEGNLREQPQVVVSQWVTKQLSESLPFLEFSDAPGAAEYSIVVALRDDSSPWPIGDIKLDLELREARSDSMLTACDVGMVLQGKPEFYAPLLSTRLTDDSTWISSRVREYLTKTKGDELLPHIVITSVPVTITANNYLQTHTLNTDLRVTRLNTVLEVLLPQQHMLFRVCDRIWLSGPIIPDVDGMCETSSPSPIGAGTSGPYELVIRSYHR